jgi:hypothetical protein
MPQAVGSIENQYTVKSTGICPITNGYTFRSVPSVPNRPFSEHLGRLGRLLGYIPLLWDKQKIHLSHNS